MPASNRGVNAGLQSNLMVDSRTFSILFLPKACRYRRLFEKLFSASRGAENPTGRFGDCPNLVPVAERLALRR